MKKIQKILLGLLATLLLFTIIQVPTHASSLLDPPKKANFGVYNLTKSKLGLAVKKNEYAQGATFEVYKGNKLYKTYASTATIKGNKYFWGTPKTAVSFSAKTVYKYRVRYYKIKDGNRVYGSWSEFRYFVKAPSPKSVRAYSKSGLKFKLSGCSGVSKYVIYVSKKKASGYKKVKTIKIGASKTKQITITKNYKKKGKNYIKIVPYIKGYGISDTLFTYCYNIK